MPRSAKTPPPQAKPYSTLAGPFQKLPNHKRYAVQFTDLKSSDNIIYRNWTRFMAYGSLALTLGLAFVLFQPDHWIALKQPDSATQTFNWIMLGCLAALQTFIIIGTYSATRSTLKSKDPVPVLPPKGLKVAFATTRAPAEPVDIVRTTLKAMKKVTYKDGKVDVWLLDETKDPELKKMCRQLKVKYFSRKDIEKWNAPSGFLATRSKHGNFNSWRQHLTDKGLTYDILAGVDTDQVPEPNYLERLLGYFRDQDTAFVVGPQVYGNYRPGLDGLVARWAESQASFFQSTIQRAGNASSSPMFVGTNYAVRMKVLDQIGGFQPCITEDMATGLAIHTKRNPKTNKRWKSVYTPDVLAIGEGPDMWAPMFTQQWRWAAGTFDTWRRVVWKVFYKLSPKSMLHYFLMLTFYPITALTWLLGIASTMIYLITGATAIIAPWSQFVSLYLMSLVMQLSLYFWNRRFNVSPHEPAGSFGISGMVLTSLTAPIYLSALVGVAIGKKPHFVVTVKGAASRSFETLKTFKIHLLWAAVLAAGLAYGFAIGNDHPAMLIWAGVQLVICLTPVAIGWVAWLPLKLRQKNYADEQLMASGETTNG